MDESSVEGEKGKSQAVDMVFVGSETGQLELRHPPAFHPRSNNSVFGTFSLTTMNTKYSQSHKLIAPLHHCTTPDLALHVILGTSTSTPALHLNFFLNNTLHSHGQTLRQLTSSSTTLNALLAYLDATWTSITDEWTEVEKIRGDVVTHLTQSLDQDPEPIPTWWTDEYKQDASSALLCLLMTGASEPEVAQWFTEKFATVVRPLTALLTGEQNVRKWEKRILDGYDAIRTLIHEHVVPVLERISLVLSTLRGISIWYQPPFHRLIGGGVINLCNYRWMTVLSPRRWACINDCSSALLKY